MVRILESGAPAKDHAREWPRTIAAALAPWKPIPRINTEVRPGSIGSQRLQVRGGVDPERRLLAQSRECLWPYLAQARGHGEAAQAGRGPGHQLRAFEAFEAAEPGSNTFENGLSVCPRLGEGQNILNRLLEHVT